MGRDMVIFIADSKVRFYFFLSTKNWLWAHQGSHLMGSGISSSGDEAGGT